MKKKIGIILFVCMIFITCFLFIKNTLNNRTEIDNKIIGENTAESIKENINISIANKTEMTDVNNSNFNTINQHIPENTNINSDNNNNNNNNNDNNDLFANDVKLNYNKNNVTIEVVEDSITNSSITLSITDKNEDTYGWGEYYIIQKKDNNNWNDLELIKEKRFTDLGFKLDENGNFLQRINWKKYYGELANGTYRIVKPIYDNNVGDYIFFYSNEFEIK